MLRPVAAKLALGRIDPIVYGSDRGICRWVTNTSEYGVFAVVRGWPWPPSANTRRTPEQGVLYRCIGTLFKSGSTCVDGVDALA